MGPTHIFTAALVTSASVFGTIPARANDEPAYTGREVAPLDSSAPPPVIAATACSLQPVLIVDGRVRRIDIQVDGRRCSTTPAPEGAIPMNMRIEHDPSQQVVIEASVPSDVSSELVRAAVLDTRRELGSRLARALAPPPAQAAPQPAQYTAWNDARTEPKEPFSPAMMGVGILSIIGGGFMFVCGAFGMVFVNPDHEGLMAALLLGGSAALAIGIPLLVIGHHKVTRVAASISPTGGSLRLTF